MFFRVNDELRAKPCAMDGNTKSGANEMRFFRVRHLTRKPEDDRRLQESNIGKGT